MKIRLYQVNTLKAPEKVFVSHAEAGNISLSDYDCNYVGYVDCEDLEAVYRMFNINQPARYIGRSMSVSDIVEVVESAADATKRGFYYCDSIGFKYLGEAL